MSLQLLRLGTPHPAIDIGAWLLRQLAGTPLGKQLLDNPAQVVSGLATPSSGRGTKGNR